MLLGGPGLEFVGAGIVFETRPSGELVVAVKREGGERRKERKELGLGSPGR
jgi:hypothetical protein